MSGTSEDRVASAVESSLQPSETTYATIDHPSQSHDGHQDVFQVHKDASGRVTAEKWHVSDSGKKWWQ